MYLLNVSFSQNPAQVEPQKEAHGVWVKKYFENGTFLLAGPKKSGLGGAILVKSIDKSELMKILSEDSYVIADVADYQITDFDAKLSAKGLENLINS
jgi:uncharacterized protein YciI